MNIVNERKAKDRDASQSQEFRLSCLGLLLSGFALKALLLLSQRILDLTVLTANDVLMLVFAFGLAYQDIVIFAGALDEGGKRAVRAPASRVLLLPYLFFCMAFYPAFFS